MPNDPSCAAEGISQTQSDVGRRGPRFWRRWANSLPQDRPSKAQVSLQATLEALSQPREPLTDELIGHEVDEHFMLDSNMFLKNLRSARRGASGGLSGMTTEHLRPILDNSRDSELLFLLSQEFAHSRAPWEVVRVVGTGRLTALQKPSGGVRGIVSGEVFRRLVARTMAQQLAPALEKATAPFQYALSTKSGCECVAHAVQALTDFDPDATLLSIDGIGAFDLISRNAMLQGLANVEGGGRAVPFVSQFYASPSTYIWEDEFGETFEIQQGEGGEQGDPLMPALFSVGQHPVLVEVQSTLKLGGKDVRFS